MLAVILLILCACEAQGGASSKKPCGKLNKAVDLIDTGVALRRKGSVVDAMECFEKAIRKYPAQATSASIQLAELQVENRDTEGAVKTLQAAILQSPSAFEAYSALANVHLSRSEHAEAIAAYEVALRGRPTRADWNNLGLSLAAARRLPEAITAYNQALNQVGDAGSANSVMLNLGNAKLETGDYEGAIATFKELVERDPQSAPSHFSLGRAYHHKGDLHAALPLMERALELQPGFSHALRSIAAINTLLGKDKPAADLLVAAANVNPTAQTCNSAADALGDAGRYDEALAMYTRALELQPHFPEAFYSRLHYLIHTCAWDQLEHNVPHMLRIVEKELADGVESQITPVESLVSLEPLLLKRVAANFAQRSLNRMVGSPFTKQADLIPGQRLKIGYLSGGFRNHPDGKNMQGVFLRHDRSRFEVFCYSVKREESDLQRKIDKSCEHFFELSALSHEAAAANINGDGVHVLLDVNGYTGEGVREGRNIIFAHRPARIQINFLAWVATSGAEYIQHVVSDIVASPPELRHFYSETMLYMPPSYFVSDLKQSGGDIPRNVTRKAMAKRRKAAGLPVSAKVVYSGFNQLWKVDRSIFRVWMSILERVPSAILWLPIFPDVAVPNLRKAAAEMGVNVSRLVFTPLFSAEEHVFIKSLADVQLDCYVYNGHTSGADVLWAGVPTVSMPAEKQSARVGASLLFGLNYPHTVARNLKDYEDVAVALGKAILAGKQDARLNITENLSKAGLFDTAAWVRAMESALTRAWEVGQARKQPMHVLPCAK